MDPFFYIFPSNSQIRVPSGIKSAVIFLNFVILTKWKYIFNIPVMAAQTLHLILFLTFVNEKENNLYLDVCPRHNLFQEVNCFPKATLSVCVLLMSKEKYRCIFVNLTTVIVLIILQVSLLLANAFAFIVELK